MVSQCCTTNRFLFLCVYILPSGNDPSTVPIMMQIDTFGLK